MLYCSTEVDTLVFSSVIVVDLFEILVFVVAIGVVTHSPPFYILLFSSLPL